MKPQWTPGPWHPPAPWPPLNDKRPRFEVQGGHESIAIVRSSLDDATLIAAAPDLYEALDELLDYAIALANYHSHDSDDGGTFSKARAALAKARGE